MFYRAEALDVAGVRVVTTADSSPWRYAPHATRRGAEQGRCAIWVASRPCR